MGDDLKNRIVGQDHAIDILVSSIQRAKLVLKIPIDQLGLLYFLDHQV